MTIDAMGCQTEMAAQIVSQGAEYGLALKENHPHVHEKVVRCFEQQALSTSGLGSQKEATSSFESTDGDHGRIEVRRDRQVTDVTWLEERSQWKALQRVGMVEAERHVGETVSVERRYDLSSLGLDARQFANAVRGHWRIENTVHWS